MLYFSYCQRHFKVKLFCIYIQEVLLHRSSEIIRIFHRWWQNLGLCSLLNGFKLRQFLYDLLLLLKTESWDMPELQSLAETPEVLWQRADQCMYGLVTPDENGNDTPAKKPTGCLSSSWCILDELSFCCDHTHVHQHLITGQRQQPCTRQRFARRFVGDWPSSDRTATADLPENSASVERISRPC